MTRDEAIEKVNAVWAKHGLHVGDVEAEVDMLVSLGLLKLDEPEPEPVRGKRPWRISTREGAIIIRDANNFIIGDLNSGGMDWAQAIVNAANDELLCDARSTSNRPAAGADIREPRTIADDCFEYLAQHNIIDARRAVETIYAGGFHITKGNEPTSARVPQPLRDELERIYEAMAGTGFMMPGRSETVAMFIEHLLARTPKGSPQPQEPAHKDEIVEVLETSIPVSTAIHVVNRLLEKFDIVRKR